MSPKKTSKTTTAKKPAAARPILTGSDAMAVLKSPSPKKALAALAEQTAPASPTEPKPPAMAKVAPDGVDPELVVFAVRIERTLRDRLHEVAGSAKASQLVRNLIVAATSGDEAALHDILDSIKVKPAA